jgi:hypothetical protein
MNPEEIQSSLATIRRLCDLAVRNAANGTAGTAIGPLALAVETLAGIVEQMTQAQITAERRDDFVSWSPQAW